MSADAVGEGDFWTRFVLAALAAWRITHLLAREDGPWNVVARVRARMGSGVAGQMMDCMLCLGLWVAIPLTFFVTGEPERWLVSWLAIAGAAGLLDRIGHEPLVLHAQPEMNEGGTDNGMLRPESRQTD
jgi:Protein of unknown function (DUF1360)